MSRGAMFSTICGSSPISSLDALLVLGRRLAHRRVDDLDADLLKAETTDQDLTPPV